jgi:tetratricopeptide (TPR) repeat protein
MYCGQIKGLYLGDYEAGLTLLEDAIGTWEDLPGELFPLLRIAQIRVQQRRYDAARKSLKRARHIAEQYTSDIARAGLNLVSAIHFNSLGEEMGLRATLELTAQTFTLATENPQLFQQYQLAAKCEAAAAHLGLARVLTGEGERQRHLLRALESSQLALDLFETYECVRPIECTSQEILYRHSLALKANGHEAQATEYLQRAYDEMMQKNDLIPADSHFRHTFLENVPLHREIRAAVSALE